ncbi:hypothetical protein HPP92_021457 [Vanilla planifolia]|uniref:Pentacotripeptide-repeat region of PRORP domain-containing protein n=1 Tax=Vanilla planifolia TaxID=51239 RepID=A0A835PYQ7_VANPL|nr:hypothetical protein HPP92_021457 [Vanilla planifolia]
MRAAASLLVRRNSFLHALRYSPLPVGCLFIYPPHSSSSPSASPSRRLLHDLPSNPISNHADPLPSRLLQPIHNASPAAPGTDEEGEEDAAMNEFLSRFVWSIRGKISETYPDLSRDTRDTMILVICQKVVARLEPGSESTASSEPPFELSEDLWKTIWEVSAAVQEAMRRDRVRMELRKYLHCDEVKQMCRFASDVGIRGEFLRELRFKWAKEKLEEVDFYREIDRMREQVKIEEQKENGLIPDSKEEKDVMPKVTALPQRRGKIKYKIYGLDMSDPKWLEISHKLEEAEKYIMPMEVQPVVGQSKRVEDKIMSLDPNKDDLQPLLKDFAETLSAKRVDLLALLNRIKERNEDLYFKAAELLLDEHTFDTNIRDYSKLIDVHSKAGRIQDAERILSKMLEKGIQPDVLTSIILVHMYCKSGDLNRAKEAFEKLKQEGFQPDLAVYSSMITAYVNAGIPKQGEFLIREMEGNDVKPTRELYMQLLQAFASSGQVDAAQRIVNTMRFAGIQLTIEAYAFREAYSQAGDPDQAQGHFDHMMTTGLKPDDKCTACMVAAYAKKNFLDKALDLLLKLEKDGFEPGIETNSVLVDWLGRLQLVEEVELLLKKIEEIGEPPLLVHVSLCDMYSMAKNEHKARQALNVLEGKKNLLKADQFERIVRGLLAGGFSSDAKRMYDVMQQQGFTPSEQTKVILTAAQSIPRPTLQRRN